MRTTAAFLGLLGALSLTAPAAPGRAAPSIILDGQAVASDAPPVVSGARILVPLRGVFERLGARVAFDSRSGVATARSARSFVSLRAGARRAFVNGSAVTLDTPAREVAGRIEVPLRFVAQALGAAVDFNAATATVVIVSGARPGNFVAILSGADRLPVAGAYHRHAAPAVQERRPSPDSLVGSDYPQIFARFSGGSAAVDPASVRVELDGTDVTDSASISSAYFTYTAPYGLQDGRHSVAVSGSTADGTPFADEWTFRVDGGNYMRASSIIGYAPYPYGYPGYGFCPPGFSVYAPGSGFYYAGSVIRIVFFSRFFPFGSGFFNIAGLPGSFALTPWQGFPGYYIGTVVVPFGVRSNAAMIAAHFTTADGRRVVVHSTAPVEIDGTRRTLPGGLRFAVMPQLVTRPISPAGVVEFRRLPDRNIVQGAQMPGTLIVLPSRPLRAEPLPAPAPAQLPLPNAARPFVPLPPAVPIPATPAQPARSGAVPMKREPAPVPPTQRRRG
jgi:hypothetical protein